jgi:hypothetical protein
MKNKRYLLLILVLVLLTLNCLPKDVVDLDLGKIEDGFYINKSFNLKAPVPQGWDFADDATRLEIMNAELSPLALEGNRTNQTLEQSITKTLYFFSFSRYPPDEAFEKNYNASGFAENINYLPTEINKVEDYFYYLKSAFDKSELEYTHDDTYSEIQIEGRTFKTFGTIVKLEEQMLMQEFYFFLKSNFVIVFVITYWTEEQKKELQDIIGKIELG